MRAYLRKLFWIDNKNLRIKIEEMYIYNMYVYKLQSNLYIEALKHITF